MYIISNTEYINNSRVQFTKVRRLVSNMVFYCLVARNTECAMTQLPDISPHRAETETNLEGVGPVALSYGALSLFGGLG